mmetsp:Transcript_8971/g.24427  ORF Transcript_8971/g.24427 Transcript_8971/m.24427 type:complete len:278 (-) Transcript_8971:107-940(-)
MPNPQATPSMDVTLGKNAPMPVGSSRSSTVMAACPVGLRASSGGKRCCTWTRSEATQSGIETIRMQPTSACPSAAAESVAGNARRMFSGVSAPWEANPARPMSVYMEDMNVTDRRIILFTRCALARCSCRNTGTATWWHVRALSTIDQARGSSLKASHELGPAAAPAGLKAVAASAPAAPGRAARTTSRTVTYTRKTGPTMAAYRRAPTSRTAHSGKTSAMAVKRAVLAVAPSGSRQGSRPARNFRCVPVARTMVTERTADNTLPARGPSRQATPAE